MLFTQVWTTHNGIHEGGRCTHALPPSGDADSALCGIDLSGYLANTGRTRDRPVAELHFYVDCKRCLRILRKGNGEAKL